MNVSNLWFIIFLRSDVMLIDSCFHSWKNKGANQSFAGGINNMVVTDWLGQNKTKYTRLKNWLKWIWCYGKYRMVIQSDYQANTKHLEYKKDLNDSTNSQIFKAFTAVLVSHVSCWKWYVFQFGWKKKTVVVALYHKSFWTDDHWATRLKHWVIQCLADRQRISWSRREC